MQRIATGDLVDKSDLGIVVARDEVAHLAALAQSVLEWRGGDVGENAFELNHGTAGGAAAAHEPRHDADCVLASDRRRLAPLPASITARSEIIPLLGK
jgi:hypothetical protein